MGPAGPTGAQGPQGERGAPGQAAATPTGSPDLAGTTGLPPQAVTCAPGADFCATSTRVATCTLSGSDAVLGADCVAQGSATNPASCATSGCPGGHSACCRRQSPLWKWNLTAPELSGETYTPSTDPGSFFFTVDHVCGGASFELRSVIMVRPLSACPRNDASIAISFQRYNVRQGSTVDLSSSDVDMVYNVAGDECRSWTGSIRIDSDLPSWQVTINAQCFRGSGAPPLSLTGTLGGNE